MKTHLSRLIILLMLAISLSLAGCRITSDDDSDNDDNEDNPSPITEPLYVDGDGQAEITSPPIFYPSSLAPGEQLNVSVMVDSDVKYFKVILTDLAGNQVAGMSLPTEVINNVSNPGVNLTILPDAVAGTYYAMIFVCANDAGCAPESTDASFTQYINNPSQSGKHLKVVGPGESPTTVSTILNVTTFEVTAGAAGITSIDGDGIAEITGVPSFNLSSVAAGGTLSVTVPVDSDVTRMAVDLGWMNGGTFQLKVSGELTGLSGGGNKTLDIILPGAAEARIDYFAQVFVCSDDSTACDYANASLVYYYDDPDAPGTYLKLKDLTTTPILTSTGVAIPYFAVTAP